MRSLFKIASVVGLITALAFDLQNAFAQGATTNTYYPGPVAGPLSALNTPPGLGGTTPQTLFNQIELSNAITAGSTYTFNVTNGVGSNTVFDCEGYDYIGFAFLCQTQTAPGTNTATLKIGYIPDGTNPETVPSYTDVTGVLATNYVWFTNNIPTRGCKAIYVASITEPAGGVVLTNYYTTNGPGGPTIEWIATANHLQGTVKVTPR